jgi:hypothetical protein
MIFPENCDKCNPEGENVQLPTYMRIALPKPPKPDGSSKTVQTGIPAKTAVDPTEGLQQLVFCRTKTADTSNASKSTCDVNFSMLVVDVPKIDASAPKAGLKKQADPISVTDTKLTLKGTLLEQAVLVEYEKTPLSFKVVSADKDTNLEVDLGGLVGKPGTYTLLVTFADKTAVAQQFTIKKSGS